MRTLAFKMYLKKGKYEEYKKRHDKIWPELNKILKNSGILEYYIFFDSESNCLFAFQKYKSKGSQELDDNPVVKRWWDFMKDIMETNTDNSPKQKDLNQVFSLV
ncbi:MAG: L-rhamnose mutarotase [Flavobacteriaceae bacterium]|nr:L-rhamnose mutarotase [Flavobacteriaceae bacterium]